MESDSLDHIINSFNATTKEDWLKAARLELDGADPFQKLTRENSGLTIAPYYDERDVSSDRFQLKAVCSYPGQTGHTVKRTKCLTAILAGKALVS